MQNFLMQPIAAIAISIILGHVLGKVGVRSFKLGSSATLFTGLLVSYMIGINTDQSVKISSEYFDLSLIAFISTVGLLAGKDIQAVIKSYGAKLILQGIAITGLGALFVRVAFDIFPELRSELVGAYVGALTSSPGLATAIETAGNSEIASSIGLGYAIAYIPGVLMVILFTRLMGTQMNSAKNMLGIIGNLNTHKKSKRTEEIVAFNMIAYVSLILMGVLLGNVELTISKDLNFSFGITGGVLITTLVGGHWFKKNVFSENILNVIKSLGLHSFLAIVGLNYGYKAIVALMEVGIQIMLIGFIVATLCILVGFLFGKYVLKLSKEVVIGSICGGMTSTPGLAAAVEIFGTDSIVSAYGATYPFALIGMIFFTNLLI